MDMSYAPSEKNFPWLNCVFVEKKIWRNRGNFDVSSPTTRIDKFFYQFHHELLKIWRNRGNFDVSSPTTRIDKFFYQFHHELFHL